MGNFRAIQPAALLAPYVKQYWFLTADDALQQSQRFIPAGSMGIVFNRGELVYSSLENNLLPRSYVFGQSTTYTDLVFKALNLIIVVLHPAGARAFLKMPVNELKGQSVSVECFNDCLFTELEERLRSTTDDTACVYWIEQFLLKRIRNFEAYNFKRLESVMNSIHYGEQDISKLAQTACLGYKQFKRVFVDYVGLNPKEFVQIARFTKASHILQTQPLVSLSELAYACGYYDKSHLIRDIKMFSGYTPAEFRVNSDPYSDYMSLFQSFFINTNK